MTTKKQVIYRFLNFINERYPQDEEPQPPPKHQGRRRRPPPPQTTDTEDETSAPPQQAETPDTRSSTDAIPRNRGKTTSDEATINSPTDEPGSQDSIERLTREEIQKLKEMLSQEQNTDPDLIQTIKEFKNNLRT